MKDILVVGSINMDLVINVDEMPKKGQTILGENFNQIPGGKGANQAVAVARLGGNVAMIGKVGQDNFGNKLIQTMNSDGVDTSFIKSEKDISTGVALITVDRSGENSIVVAPGANYEIEKKDIDKAKKLIEYSKIVITQLEIPIEIVEHTLSKAKENGKYTILNPAPAQVLDRDIIKNIDLLTPNETELEILSGISIKNEEDIRKAAQKLIDLGIKELIITLGDSGCIYVNKNTFKKYDAYKVVPVDTTGAGDSFNAAIAVGLSHEKDIDEIIDFALKVGALAVTKEGAQSSLPYIDEVLDFKGRY
ncbi:ribokinase [Anaerosalibacter massiliensis]|uniref:Ribokinase n=1 Tax=Anaerosalibacter massiliensis TaxID=1347392 RepID=A0A9X2MHC3_9FIRM|nr:ribokinase [Anaerosalibacter massiliensis]MCR2043704.1 ribokinase [Anaerosalibacter massiliensis]